jgi:hypothetical protein
MTPDPRHERVHRLLTTAGPATPAALRQRLDAQAARAAAPRRSRARVALAGAVATVAAATVAALSLIDLGGAPTVAAAARPAALAATAPAPPQDARRPTLLRASFAGVDYPDWNRDFGWRTTGQRRDTIDGRPTRTVFYQHTHHRIGYTVVDGEALKPPSGAQRFVVNGLEMLAYKDGRRDVVTFERNGRTCVLAGVVHRRSTLIKLASWRAEGAISF